QMVFMVQKEVADRICAEPDTAEYGRLSIMIQSRCEVEQLFQVGPGSFNPPPKVDSAVIRLNPRQADRVLDHQLFQNLVCTTFTKRRKPIRNALISLVDDRLPARAGIYPACCSEQIAGQIWNDLANLVYQQLQDMGTCTRGSQLPISAQIPSFIRIRSRMFRC